MKRSSLTRSIAISRRSQSGRRASRPATDTSGRSAPDSVYSTQAGSSSSSRMTATSSLEPSPGCAASSSGRRPGTNGTIRIASGSPRASSASAAARSVVASTPVARTF